MNKIKATLESAQSHACAYERLQRAIAELKNPANDHEDVVELATAAYDAATEAIREARAGTLAVRTATQTIVGSADPQRIAMPSTDASARTPVVEGQQHQCESYAGDPGASAPRCESYKGHAGPCFIRRFSASAPPLDPSRLKEIAERFIREVRVYDLSADIVRALTGKPSPSIEDQVAQRIEAELRRVLDEVQR